MPATERHFFELAKKEGYSDYLLDIFVYRWCSLTNVSEFMWEVIYAQVRELCSAASGHYTNAWSLCLVCVLSSCTQLGDINTRAGCAPTQVALVSEF